MKIGFVLDDTLDSSDGVQQYVLTLGQWLTTQKHDVHYLVGQTKRTDIPNIHSMSRNIGVHFNGNRMTIPLPASRQRISSLMRDLSLDVVHVQMPYSPTMGAKVLCAASSKTKRVGTFHILPFGSLQRLGAKALFLWLHRSVKKLQQVFSVSKPAQAFAQSLGVESVVLPNVVDMQRFAGGKKLKQYVDSFTIVFLGRLVERKGCKELLQAIYILVENKAIPNLKVVICGAGPLQESLQSMVRQHDLSEFVEFVGFVSEEAKVNYLRTADVAIFPSLGGESFGIVLLEAMAAGSGVVIGGNNPGYASVLHELPDSLVDPRDSQAMARLISHVYTDSAFRQSLHIAQQTLVKQYDVATVGKKLVSYYQEVQ